MEFNILLFEAPYNIGIFPAEESKLYQDGMSQLTIREGFEEAHN